MSTSILILTDNDERDLPGCLQSLRWTDDVHLMDAFSSDRTPQIAEKFGARVTQRAFDNQASQLNAALNGIAFKYPWLLLLNADERVTVGLEAELKLMMYHMGPEMAYLIRRREFSGERREKRNQAGSVHLRYFSWDAVRYEGENEAFALVDGPVGKLEAPFDHAPRLTGSDRGLCPQYRKPRPEPAGLGLRGFLRFAHGFFVNATTS